MSQRLFRMRPSRCLIPLLLCAVALVLGCGGSNHKNTNRASTAAPSRSNTNNGITIQLVPSGTAQGPGGTPAGFAFAPTPVPTCGPSDLLVLVDKSHALPPEYVPPDLVTVRADIASPGAPIAVQLRKEAADALARMIADARTQGIYLLAQSAYRSYDYQAQVYNNEVQTFGQAKADSESARPGHSEHQLGTAVDFTTRTLQYDLNDSFATTPEGRWLAQHAADYGFVLSYPQGKESVTGYVYEPWHYRYIGVQAAKEFVASGLTLNQWLAQHQAPCAP